ncbi:MAG: hypothetical protein N2645_15575 [Clostridia bacterium]|nr:hypothetical protein [Clostridia bacterium]
MKLAGRISKIKSEGYERYLKIDFDDKSLGSLWFYFVDCDQYAENEDEQGILRIGQKVKVVPSIEWVNTYTKVNSSEETVLKQPIQESPHVEAIALVTQIIDEDTIVCDLGTLSQITIELEKKADSIRVGDKIKFTGNLKAEIL